MTVNDCLPDKAEDKAPALRLRYDYNTVTTGLCACDVHTFNSNEHTLLDLETEAIYCDL